jgi:hypothetical protein
MVLTMSSDRLRQRTEETVARHSQQYCSAAWTGSGGVDSGVSCSGGAGDSSAADTDAVDLSVSVSPGVALLSHLLLQRMSASVTSTTVSATSVTDSGTDSDRNASLALSRALAAVGAVERAWAHMQTGKGSVVGRLPLPPQSVRSCV